mmetsp:Transcript_64035/g.152712  ORF Transcript_64035/g.152712 Transcript_64035/m.152712 type:complete len:195 (-) Transcript_64035:289-873(-)
MEASDEEAANSAKLEQFARFLQRNLDKTVVWIKTRWAFLVVVIVLYGVRVFLKQGFYIVTYGLGIYMLNLFINFLSPAVDPEAEEGQSILPTTEAGEFRPFNRKLPEFKFWINALRAVSIALTMTLFDFFDLPVFWPILLAYFILLLILTMKDRIKHMIKHKYLPFSLGKKTYGELTKLKAPGADGAKSAKSDK